MSGVVLISNIQAMYPFKVLSVIIIIVSKKSEYLFSAIAQTEFSGTQLFIQTSLNVSEYSDQPVHLHSLISLHHTLYKIYCFFVQIALTDQVAGCAD